MALNDVFDAELDQEERPERPIPSGRVSLSAARVYLLAPAREDIPGSKPRNRKELVEGFLMVGLGLSAVCAVFILVFIFLFLRAEVEPAVIQ